MTADQQFVVDVAALFVGDVPVDPEVLDKAVLIALEAGVGDLPDMIDIGGVEIPVGEVIIKLLLPVVRGGIEALIDLCQPVRVVVTNPLGVSGLIHD